MPKPEPTICYSCTLASARAVSLTAACHANNHATIPMSEWTDRWGALDTPLESIRARYAIEADPARVDRDVRPGPKPRMDLAIA